MKPIYKSLALAAMTLQVAVNLQAQANDGESVSNTPIPAELLDSLRVELIAPNVSGARDLIKSGECTISGSELSIELATGEWMKGGVYRVQVSATFGTQTEVIYALDVTVPRYETLASEPQEYEDTVSVVVTFGGGGGGADATVYALDGDGNANITLPLTVNGSVQEGSTYSEVAELNVVVLTPLQKAQAQGATGISFDYCDTNDSIESSVNVTIYADEECTQKVGSTTKDTKHATISDFSGDFFNLQDGETISAGTYYARIERATSGNNSHAEGNITTASGNNSHAEGNITTASGNNSHAEGDMTTASGYCSHAEGSGTIASDFNSHAEGNRTTASNASSHAEGQGTTASGYCSHAEGSGTIASNFNSHAEGRGTIASQPNQHVCGQYNVEDTDNSFQFIVGNGADEANLHNAFAVTKSGELALFEADGTPVILDAATLKALIASI